MYKLLPIGGIGAELGVCRGHNAAHLFLCTKPEKLYLVDTWEFNPDTFIHHTPDLYYNDWQDDVKDMFKEFLGDRVFTVKKTSVEFLSDLPDKYLDWVYIDSSHDFDTTKKEIELSLKKVKTGGIISGHDFCVMEKVWKTSIIRVVINEIQNGKLKMEAITNEYFPSFCCRVI